MLGCQDFCGHYEWTFHYIRSRWGEEALERYWREAIAGESQRHYAEAAKNNGLRGLYDQYAQTGEDERCDWTYTLDEAKNFLRCDMRECPSKGFLLKNDLNADGDYCDHCQNWEIPLMRSVGVEIVAHEHNHCGQCWAVYRMAGQPFEAVDLPCDIRNDARWRHGYLHRWEKDRRLPLAPELGDAYDACETLKVWWKNAAQQSPMVRIAADADYNDRNRCPFEPAAVLFDSPPADLKATALRYLEMPPELRPLLLYAYLPCVPFIDFTVVGLPRPLPLLPLLIYQGVYEHHPGGATPPIAGFLRWFLAALKK